MAPISLARPRPVSSLHQLIALQAFTPPSNGPPSSFIHLSLQYEWTTSPLQLSAER